MSLPEYNFEPSRDDRLSLYIQGRKKPLACRLRKSERLGTTCFITWLRPDALGRVQLKLGDGRELPLSRIIAIASERTVVQHRCGEPRCVNPDHLALSHEKTFSEERVEEIESWPGGPERALERIERQIADLQEERQLILADLGRAELSPLEIVRLKLKRIAQHIGLRSSARTVRSTPPRSTVH